MKNFLPRRKIRALNIFITLFGLSACGTGGQFADLPDNFQNFRSAHLYAPDQTTTQAAKKVLRLGGNAADITVAMGYASLMSHTSNSHLRAKGQCLAYDAETQHAYSIDFSDYNGTLVQGMNALHASFGRLPFSGILSPAHQLALLGNTSTNKAASVPPDPELVNTLQTLMRYPLDFQKHAPFVTDNIWQQKIALTHADQTAVADDRLMTVHNSGFARNNAEPRGIYSGISFGALDASGLSTLCWIGMAGQQPPRLVMAYNPNTSAIKLSGVFAPEYADSDIFAHWESLYENNTLPHQRQGRLILSYCPLGLPIKDSKTSIQCTAFSASDGSMGYVKRQ